MTMLVRMWQNIKFTSFFMSTKNLHIKSFTLIPSRLYFYGCVFTTTIVSLNIPGGVLFTDFVKQLKKDRCFHKLN